MNRVTWRLVGQRQVRTTFFAVQPTIEQAIARAVEAWDVDAERVVVLSGARDMATRSDGSVAEMRELRTIEEDDRAALAAWRQDNDGVDTVSTSQRDGSNTMEPKYPHVEVQLTGEDGNAFAVLGAVQRALRNAGVDSADVDAYFADATSGDYDNLLRVTMQTVTVL